MSIKEEIVKMIQDYYLKSGDRQNKPTELDVPWDKEMDFCLLTTNEIGNLAGELVVKSPREVFKTFLGLKINWGAKEFRVR